jgi:hypothetical protein
VRKSRGNDKDITGMQAEALLPGLMCPTTGFDNHQFGIVMVVNLSRKLGPLRHNPDWEFGGIVGWWHAKHDRIML